MLSQNPYPMKKLLLTASGIAGLAILLSISFTPESQGSSSGPCEDSHTFCFSTCANDYDPVDDCAALAYCEFQCTKGYCACLFGLNTPAYDNCVRAARVIWRQALADCACDPSGP